MCQEALNRRLLARQRLSKLSGSCGAAVLRTGVATWLPAQNGYPFNPWRPFVTAISPVWTAVWMTRVFNSEPIVC